VLKCNGKATPVNYRPLNLFLTVNKPRSILHNPKLKAIIFDLDGTLTDSDKVHYQVFQTLLEQRGITLNKTLYKEKISGRQNTAIMADFFPEMSAAEAQAFSEQKEATFREAAKHQLQPLPGLLDFIARIQQQNWAIAVVTNAPTKNAIFMLETLGLSKTFNPVVIGDELPRGKPDPLPYQTALNKLTIAADEAITFEDSVTGIRSAVGAGIHTIGITTTHSPNVLIDSGASSAIADFTDPHIATLF